MVDDDFVAAVRTQRCLNSLGDGLAGLDITDNGTIFGIVAVKFSIISLLILIGSFSTSYDFFLARFCCHLAGDRVASLTSDSQV